MSRPHCFRGSKVNNHGGDEVPKEKTLLQDAMQDAQELASEDAGRPSAHLRSVILAPLGLSFSLRKRTQKLLPPVVVKFKFEKASEQS